MTVRRAVAAAEAHRPPNSSERRHDAKMAATGTATRTSTGTLRGHHRPTATTTITTNNNTNNDDFVKKHVEKAAPTPPTTVHVVALVVRRERTVAVYCKGSGETVPCTRLYVADESYEGMPVVLWRTHAGMDVGEEGAHN